MNSESTLRGMFTIHEVAEALANQPCGFVHGNRAKGWTCQDELRYFEQHPDKYGNPLAKELASRSKFCWSCAARDALERSGFRVPLRMEMGRVG